MSPISYKTAGDQHRFGRGLKKVRAFISIQSNARAILSERSASTAAPRASSGIPGPGKKQRMIPALISHTPMIN
jgi:hypothetical protein